MKLLLILSVVFFATISFANSEDVKGLIVGGRDANIEDYPYVAGIENFGFLLCTGSIITPRSILTAAHCILVNVPVTISIFVGSHGRSGQFGRTYGAIRLFLHPQYKHIPSPFEIFNDIAIVRTIRPIRYSPRVQPIPLNFDFVPGGAEVIATGWGFVNDTPVNIIAEQLQRLDMVALTNTACAEIYRGSPGLSENAVTAEKLCTVAGPNQGVCGGDSGGPVAWRGTVVGVACWTGRPCGSAPAVYVRVSEHRDWLLRHI